jgi:hypothetical protein
MDKKESFLAKFFLATIPAILIAFATNSFNKKQSAGEKQEIRHELSVQLAKSLENSNEQLNHWIEKYEALSNKYDDLRQRGGTGASTLRPRPTAAEAASHPDPGGEPQSMSSKAAEVSGTWRTPDQTVVWSFANGRIQLASSELLPGMLSGSGTYRQEGETVQASIDLDVAYYLPVNQRINFNGKILNGGKIITGTSTDPQGLVSAISLHR